MLEPPEVRRAPVGALAIDEAAPREELEDVVPRLENLPLEGLAAANDIAHALLSLARNADRCEFTGTIEPRQFGRIVPVVLPLHPWPFGNQGRRDDVARIAPFPHRAVQDVAGAAGLIAGAKLALTRRPVEPALQLHEVVREPVDAGGRLRGAGENGDGDGLLVYVHPEIDDCASSANSSS